MKKEKPEIGLYRYLLQRFVHNNKLTKKTFWVCFLSLVAMLRNLTTGRALKNKLLMMYFFG